MLVGLKKSYQIVLQETIAKLILLKPTKMRTLGIEFGQMVGLSKVAEAKRLIMTLAHKYHY
jgi:hypothetical protein